MLGDIGSEQTVDFATRGANILDLFITNRPSLVTRQHPIPGVSDHNIVFSEVQTHVPRKRPIKRKILLWKNADMDIIRTEVSKLSDHMSTEYTSSSDVNTMWDNFKTSCLSIMEDNVPSKMTSSRFSQPWINRRLKRMSRRKKRAFRKAKQSQSQDDMDRYIDPPEEYAQRM